MPQNRVLILLGNIKCVGMHNQLILITFSFSLYMCTVFTLMERKIQLAQENSRSRIFHNAS